ncbi:hypothetical protein [Streptomyces coeruleoprunus]|uniref:hypothetical protein n=1 Tax=Streptomyces coeruleoprunus TaxID=285563 RepID=UPI0035E9012D
MPELQPRPAAPGRRGPRVAVLAAVLLALAALLGATAGGAAAYGGAEPRPAASTVPDPAGEGQHEQTDAESAAPAANRAGRRHPRAVRPVAAPPGPRPDRLTPARRATCGPPPTIRSVRCVVLRC